VPGLLEGLDNINRLVERWIARPEAAEAPYENVTEFPRSALPG